MGASITIAGERLIAQKQADRQPLEVARFVLAYLPGLDTTQPVDRDAGLPPAEQIVYSVNISRDGSAGPNGELTREGYLSPNQVVYSLLMGTNIGDFDFNWIGLQTTEDVLLIAAYVPRQQKRRELPPLQTGNNLTRNIVLEYDGAQSLTGIEVPAASWQFDFTAQFAAMNTQIAALQAELEKKVDAASWNPPQSVSLDGPVLVYPGSSNTYQITDFDAFAVYQASSTVGTVTLAGDVLTLEIPIDAPAGLAALEVRRNEAKAVFKVPVGSAAIEQPAVIAPADGATGVTFEPELHATAFTVYPAGHDQHAETRWQVARDTAFTQLVFDQQGPDDLTAISLAVAGVRLDPSTRYYARAQYHGATLVSAWSAAVAFNTTAVYVRRPSIISPADGAVNFSAASIKGDAFSVYGGADTHAASRWQISTVADFSTVLADSGWTGSALTSWTPSVALAAASQFYVRVQYRGATAGDSGWSPVVTFTTADPLSGVYTLRATGPSARAYAALVSLDGFVYVVGGNVGGNELWRYEPGANTWRKMASLPVSLSHVGAAVHNGKIYVCGGQGAGGAVNTLRCYDPASDSWSVLASMPAAKSSPSLVAIGGFLYACFGSTNDVYRYDIASNSWSPDGTLAVSALLAFTIGGRLYALSQTTRALYVRDAAGGAWTQLASLPSARQGPAIAVVSGMLYVHGGSDSNFNYRQLTEYDPATDSWRQLPLSGPTVYYHAGCELDGSMYIFGGMNLTNSNEKVNWLYRID